jgi:protein-S-isoprenylcysteine O-methyltransferase Ste14
LGEKLRFDPRLGVQCEEEAMHLIDQRILGIVILFLLGVLVIVKQAATGSILEKPKGSLLLQLVNIFNLFFLLIVNPAAAILLIIRLLVSIDATRLIIETRWILIGIEIVGLILYVIGYLLMALALIRLGHNYQLGGSAPRSEDRFIADGPYRLVRHPMYTAALSISLGLAFLIQSWAFFSVFCIYVVLILLLIPVEEQELRKAYGTQYDDYQHKTGKLIPFVY